MTARTLQLDESAGTDAVVAQAAQVLSGGGLVIFPTETVYGVGASVNDGQGLAALRRVKERPDQQPFTIHLPSADAAERYIDLTQPRLRRLVTKALPGPVTLVVEVDEQTIAEKCEALGGAAVRDRLYHNGTVGLRCPDHDLGRSVLAAVDAPVVASSANRRGQPPPRNVDEAADAIGDDVGLVVDGGPCRFAKPSTIVRVKTVNGATRITVEREGVYDERMIRKMMHWNMLLVCTGNTCRSPMAEGIARKMLAEQRGLEESDLETAGMTVRSAGIFASDGAPANPEAVAAMQKVGVDISRHRARPLTPEMVHEADVVYCMTDAHRAGVLGLCPTAADKVHLLDDTGGIEDPIGAGATTYQRTAEMIRRRLEHRLAEQQP